MVIYLYFSCKIVIFQVPFELKTELMNFIQEKLYSRFVLSMSDLKRLFNVKFSSLPPGHILGKGVSDKLIEKTVLEVGGISLAAKVCITKV